MPAIKVSNRPYTAQRGGKQTRVRRRGWVKPGLPRSLSPLKNSSRVGRCQCLRIMAPPIRSSSSWVLVVTAGWKPLSARRCLDSSMSYRLIAAGIWEDLPMSALSLRRAMLGGSGLRFLLRFVALAGGSLVAELMLLGTAAVASAFLARALALDFFLSMMKAGASERVAAASECQRGRGV